MMERELLLFLLSPLACAGAGLLTRLGLPPRAMGVTAGALTLALALAEATLPGPGAPAHLPIALPVTLLTGLSLLAIFSLLPRRHATPGVVGALLGLAASQLLLVALPPGPGAALLWLTGSAFSLAALPGAARRVAAPALLLSAVLGAVGLLGGQLGLSEGVCGGLLIAGAWSRGGIAPLQSWLSGAAERAPLGVVVALAAPMPGMVLVAAAPPAVSEQVYVGLVIALGLAALASAGMAVRARGLSAATVYLLSSVQATVLIAMLDPTRISHVGALMMWMSTALALLGLGLVAAALLSRGGEEVERGGWAKATPALATAFLLFGLAAVGGPGTTDFISEDLVLHGRLAHHPLLLAVVVAGVSLQAWSVLHRFSRAFLGPERGLPLPDLLSHERLTLGLLLAVLLVTGLSPQLLEPVLRWGELTGLAALTP